MRSMWIESAIENLNGVIVLVLQLGFIALVIMILTAFVKAVTKRDKREKGKKSE